MKLNKNFHVFNPILDFTRVIIQNKPSLRYWPRVLIYYLKWFFFEPFRIIEKIGLNLFYKNYQIPEDLVFIIGYYRSGTTHLQEVLLADQRFKSMNFYQTYFSNAFNLTEKIFKKPFGWIMSSIGYLHPAHQIPFSFDLPGEEDVGMVASGFRHAASWGQLFPSRFKEYFGKFVFFENVSIKEKESFEAAYLDYVRRICLANPHKRMLFKSPPHTARIELLAKLFPKAKFISIRRNPYFVFQSNIKLWKTFRAQGLETFSDELAKENILWSMDKSFENYEKMKKVLPKNQFYEMNYEEFLESPIHHIEQIYAQLEMELNPKAYHQINNYIQIKHGLNRDHYRYTQDDIERVKSKLHQWIAPNDHTPLAH